MKGLLLLAIPLVAVLHATAGEVSPYLFYSFEDAKEFPTGTLVALVAGHHGLQVLTPEVTVMPAEGAAVSRHLDVTGAAVLAANRFTGNGQSHLEVWVKPRAVVFHDGAEFIDYDGAAVALFQSPDGTAELHALHVTEDQKGYY